MRDQHKKNNASKLQTPSFSVQDEIRRDRQMRRSGHLRRARSVTYRVLTAVLCLVLCVLMIGAVSLAVLRIDTVSVSGNARYSSEEILLSADALGQVLILLSDKAVYDRISAACPYVERIELIKDYPSSLKIKVYETEAVYCTVAHGKQFSLDRQMRVMDYTEEVSGLVSLALPELKSAVEGSTVVFLDEANTGFVFDTLDVFVNSEEPIAFTAIDLRDRYAITATIGDSVKVLFGDYRNLEVKITLAKKIIEDAMAANSARTLINVSEPSRAGAQYDFQSGF